VTGQFSDGVATSGQATAMNDGHRVFWVKIPNGQKCEGNYNVRNTNLVLVVPVVRSDNVKGEAVVTRQPSCMFGSAIVSLNSGLKGRFVFGDLRYDQNFGSGVTARTFRFSKRLELVSKFEIIE
jgi:hypothetical protein